ncbi:MAG: endonuclease V [Candidatus Aminicenantia bacterium]
MEERHILIKKAIQHQENLATKINLEWPKKKIRFIGGADAAYFNKKIVGVITVLSFPELKLIESKRAIRKIEFPYIPSFLAFREMPVLVKAFQLIKRKPDVIIVDGNGIAHPRKMGLATQFGIELNVPTIGCAKTPFYSTRDPLSEKGSYKWIINEDGEIVGVALRTRSKIKPVYISPGHLIDLKISIKVILGASIYRIPEPLRQAHLIALKSLH